MSQINLRIAFAGALGVAALAAPALAHHSTAMFEWGKEMKMDNVTVEKWVWTNPHTFLYVRDPGVKPQPFTPPPKPVLTPAAQKLADAFEAGKKNGENLQNQLANCVPPGMPGIMSMPYPIEWLFTPGRVTLAIETESQVRRIYMDGRALPTDPDPQFNGTSVGHWQGGTLVIDTVGFTPEITFTGGVHPSDKMKIHETYRLDDPNTLVGTITLTDPETLAQPYTINATWTRHRDWTMREYVCQENNRDASDAEGRPSMNLGLDDPDDPFGPPAADDKKAGQ
jgi:hypothetical protein